jgi:methylmalonyl-CoA mutase N-terminal domain/subunit
MIRMPDSKIAPKPFYRPEDVAGISYDETINDPGAYPYTRGRRPRQDGAAWIQRELSGEGEPARTNAQFKYLIEKGAMGLDVIGDTPTMALLDPDHPAAAHAVGTQGVSLCSLDDYLVLYDGLALDGLTISNSLPPTFAIAGLYEAAKARGIDPARLRGSTVQAPFYCEDCGYATHMPFKLRLRLAADSIEFAAREMPKFHAFLEDTYYISEGGLDPVEEMGLGFVEIRYLIRELLRRGLPIDGFAPRIAILLNCRMDFFGEIAKIRATRRLFARMLREEFGAQDPRSLAVVIASHTSGLSLTAQQPVNNVIRGAVQSLALVLAGAQAIEISGFDEAFRTPSPEAHLVGLRTQQVVQLETDVTKVADRRAHPRDGGAHRINGRSRGAVRQRLVPGTAPGRHGTLRARAAGGHANAGRGQRPAPAARGRHAAARGGGAEDRAVPGTDRGRARLQAWARCRAPAVRPRRHPRRVRRV